MCGYHPIGWEIFPPPASENDPSWLAEIRSFRARVLFSGGLRPSFRGADGSYHDPDPADQSAYHVVASTDQGIVASFRVIPDVHLGLCRDLIGTDGLNHVCRILAGNRKEAWEGGGWTVASSQQGNGLGIRALASGVALAEHLGLRLMLGAAGVHHGQLTKLIRAGFRPTPGFQLIHVPKFVDQVRIVYAVTRATDAGFRELVKDAAKSIRMPT